MNFIPVTKSQLDIVGDVIVTGLAHTAVVPATIDPYSLASDYENFRRCMMAAGYMSDQPDASPEPNLVGHDVFDDPGKYIKLKPSLGDEAWLAQEEAAYKKKALMTKSLLKMDKAEKILNAEFAALYEWAAFDPEADTVYVTEANRVIPFGPGILTLTTDDVVNGIMFMIDQLERTAAGRDWLDSDSTWILDAFVYVKGEKVELEL